MRKHYKPIQPFSEIVKDQLFLSALAKRWLEAWFIYIHLHLPSDSTIFNLWMCFSWGFAFALPPFLHQFILFLFSTLKGASHILTATELSAWGAPSDSVLPHHFQQNTVLQESIAYDETSLLLVGQRPQALTHTPPTPAQELELAAKALHKG